MIMVIVTPMSLSTFGVGMYLSADATVLAYAWMWLERLLSGASCHAWTAFHSVSLSPPQPAMAGCPHWERYHSQTSSSDAVLTIHSVCVCSALFCSILCTGYQLRASIYSYGPADSQPSPFALDASIRSAEALSGKQIFLFFVKSNTFNSNLTELDEMSM